MLPPVNRSTFESAVPQPADPQPDAFVCRLSDDANGTACIYLADELDIASAPHLERVLRRAELRSRRVVLDLRDLTFMDSLGLRLIADSSHRARRTGRRLLVLHGPPQVQRLFALSRAAEQLEIVEPGELEPAAQILLQGTRARGA